MSDTTFLEAFDADQLSVATPDAAIEAAWQAGFAAATEQHAAAITAQGQQAEVQILQVLSDMAFGFVEAQDAILQGLAPLFEAISTQLIPQVARAAMSAHVVELLMAAAETDVAQPLVVRIAPAAAPVLERLLAAQTSLPFVCTGDSMLGPGQAIISGRTEETMLDLSDLSADITDILAAIEPAHREDHAHG